MWCKSLIVYCVCAEQDSMLELLVQEVCLGFIQFHLSSISKRQQSPQTALKQAACPLPGHYQQIQSGKH